MAQQWIKQIGSKCGKACVLQAEKKRFNRLGIELNPESNLTLNKFDF
jgi:hypothetical protein